MLRGYELAQSKIFKNNAVQIILGRAGILKMYLRFLNRDTVDFVACKTFDLEAVVEDFEKRNSQETRCLRGKPSGNCFRVALPPPNVTGNLHLGHALTATIEDALCRHRELCGDEISWFPGFDHAGIATQTVVERRLWMDKRLRRHQISKEDFLAYCMECKNERIEEIRGQFKKLGCLLDWRKTYFTMDERFSRAVSRAFCQLHSSGLIFRDRRMVNWCPALLSTISDQEVVHVDLTESDEITIPSSEFGKRKLKVGVMHRVSYELVNRRAIVEVATTRPETVFADVALAVHPDDERYSHLIGKMVRNPLVPRRFLPVFGDKAVKPEKGTGVLKITPSHDFLDFEIAKRHIHEIFTSGLDTSCIDENGCMKNTGQLDGMDRFEAREKLLLVMFPVIELLRSVNAYGGTMKRSDGSIGVCSRTGDVVEPMMKEQWFMDCSQMNQRLLDALSNCKVSITPNFLSSNLEEWLRNNEPWCLSRQIVWGHRIPSFRLRNSKDWIVADNTEEVKRQLGQQYSANELEQDSDVLDTWFSSSLVPLVLAGWPEKNVSAGFLSVMETGYDILGFWVARMLTVCEQLSGHYPFEKIFLHGLIRDSSGRKMSKSIGNVIDPNDVIDGVGLEQMLKRVDTSALSEEEKDTARTELRKNYPDGIKKYGADALRFALLRHDVTALDISLDVNQTAAEGYRFCNKLWNLCKYAQSVWSATSKCVPARQSSHTVFDRWIISRLATTLIQFDSHMKDFNPHLAASVLQNYLLADLCDFYVETTKKSLWKSDKERLAVVCGILHEVLEKSFVALSVIMPFVSTYLLDKITTDGNWTGHSIFQKNILESQIDSDLERQMEHGIAVASALRSFRSQLKLPLDAHLIVLYTSEKCNLSRVSNAISGFLNASLIDETKYASTEAGCFLPFSVPGHPISLSIQVEGDYSVIVRDRLVEQFENAKERKKKFEQKVQKYESLCKNTDMKASLLAKNVRKANQARGVVRGVEEEIEKLYLLLQRIKSTV